MKAKVLAIMQEERCGDLSQICLHVENPSEFSRTIKTIPFPVQFILYYIRRILFSSFIAAILGLKLFKFSQYLPFSFSQQVLKYRENHVLAKITTFQEKLETIFEVGMVNLWLTSTLRFIVRVMEIRSLSHFISKIL